MDETESVLLGYFFCFVLLMVVVAFSFQKAKNTQPREDDIEKD